MSMRSATAALTLGVLFAAAAVSDEPVPTTVVDQPVVLELFTSQGCSSCQPADALLGKLAKRRDVLPLAFHVDYWDYIGWKDPFASPEATARQQRYKEALGNRFLYTPEMVIDGRADATGSDRASVSKLLRAEEARG